MVTLILLLVLVAMTLAMLLYAQRVRGSGLELSAKPPGFIPEPKGAAAERAKASFDGEKFARDMISVIPPVAYFVRGRQRRGLIYLGICVGALVVAGIAVATLALEERQRFTVFFFTITALWFGGMIDSSEGGPRRGLADGLELNLKFVDGASAALASCSRCRAVPLSSTGFCLPCAAALAGSEVAVTEPWVQVTSVAQRRSDKGLAQLRADKMVIGSIAGEAVAAPRRYDKNILRTNRMAYRSWESVPVRAWLDPANPSWLWVQEQVSTTHRGHERRTEQYPLLQLHMFDDGKLVASWMLGRLDRPFVPVALHALPAPAFRRAA